MIVRALAVLAGIAMLAGGCVASKTTVHVKRDGSGTIEQEAYWPRMDPNSFPGANGPDAAKPKPMTNEQLKAKCEEAAKRMGEGVTVQSAQIAAHPDGREGGKVVYAFQDVNQLKIGFLPAIGPMNESPAKDDKVIVFKYDKTHPGKLTIQPPPPEPAKDNANGGGAAGAQDEAMQTAMMQQVCKGCVIDFSVNVDGPIRKTNAADADKSGGTVLLLHADMDGLSKDEKAMKAMMALQKVKDPKEMSARIKSDLGKYIKLDTTGTIEVEF